jgi:UDP-N-acetylglucosamine 2-epimerase (non-hydrolysing)
LVHTGQHYDELLSDVFFRQLEILEPAANLNVGSDIAARQLATMLERLDVVVEHEAPDAVLVYGDTNSTLAAALIAAQRDLPLIHVEAGERIFRRIQVPEESNRVLTDNVAALCLTCTRRATDNLLREGYATERVRFVGDPMYDLFLWARERVAGAAEITPEKLGLERGSFHLATIHRAENTASVESLLRLLECLDRSGQPVVLPVHPRVRAMLRGVTWKPRGSLRLIDPLGYYDFMNLLLNCCRVVTDSGGVTREAFFARRPCITPMKNSWWTEIVEAGWAVETGDNLDLLSEALNSFVPENEAPEGLFGDGQSAERIVQNVASWVAANQGCDGAWHPHGSAADLPAACVSKMTYDYYRKMLSEFKKGGYRFAAFHEIDDQAVSEGHFVLMRHDIDFDLSKARQMAELEAEEAVRATYCVLVRTAHYNVLSAEGNAHVDAILRAGHHLGLHFDCAAYPADASTELLAEACAREAEILERWFGQPVRVASYHRPSPRVLSRDPRLSAPRPHTYTRLFSQTIHYLSDSRGTWSLGSPLESKTFRSGKPLHILIHPVWWNERPTSAYETLLQYAQRSRTELENSIARNNHVYRVGRLKDCVEPAAENAATIRTL